MGYYTTLIRLQYIASQNSGNVIRKGKKYLKPGQKPPNKAVTHKGPRGGVYYIIEDRHMKISGKHHELVRSKGVTKDQWEEVRQKHIAAGAESVEFIPQPEYGGVSGTKLYNIYVRNAETDKKIQETTEKNKKYGKKKNINTMLTKNSNMNIKESEPFEYEDEKKKFKLEQIDNHFSSSNTRNELVKFRITLEKPIREIQEIKVEKNASRLQLASSDNLKSQGVKGYVDVVTPDTVKEYINSVHDVILSKLKDDLSKQKIESWHWHLGCDTDKLYLSPDNFSIYNLKYRDDLKSISEEFGEYPPNEFIGRLADKSTPYKSSDSYIEPNMNRISHSNLMKIYNDLKKRNDANTEKIDASRRAKREAAKKRYDDALKEAKRTGKDQVVDEWSEECNDPNESCDIDLITEYLRPDGTKYKKRQHTW